MVVYVPRSGLGLARITLDEVEPVEGDLDVYSRCLGSLNISGVRLFIAAKERFDPTVVEAMIQDISFLIVLGKRTDFKEGTELSCPSAAISW